MAIKDNDKITPEESGSATQTALWVGGALALVAGIAVYVGIQG